MINATFTTHTNQQTTSVNNYVDKLKTFLLTGKIGDTVIPEELRIEYTSPSVDPLDTADGSETPIDPQVQDMHIQEV